jgi:hypothetical protein
MVSGGLHETEWWRGGLGWGGVSFENDRKMLGSTKG